MGFADLFKTASKVSTLSGEDNKAEEEAWDYNHENQKHDINFKKAYLKARKRVSGFICCLVFIWLMAMIYIVLSDGINRLIKTPNRFDVSDTVIITLVTTTTINILVLLNIVVRNLFPTPTLKKKENRPNNG